MRHVHLGHGPGLYALAGSLADGYVVCDRCGQARGLRLATSSTRYARRCASAFGYEAAFSHFPIVGLCPDCAGAP